MAATKSKKLSALELLQRRVSNLERKVKSLQASGREPLLTPEQEAELDRRIDAYEQGESKSIPWETLRKELFAKYGVVP